MSRRLAWALFEGRRHPGWKPLLAQIVGLQQGTTLQLREHIDRSVYKLLGWAREGLPYWRERIPTEADLARVPVLRRADLQGNLEGLIDPALPRSALRFDASGGSTGAPVRVAHDQGYWNAVLATEVAVNRAWGVEPWSRTAYLWGDDRAARALTAKERLRTRLLGRLQLNAFAMDERRMGKFATRLRRFRPEVVQGYAGALDLFAGFLLARGDASLRPRVVRSAAETLLAPQRERIERAFGVPVRDVYGSRESAWLAAQCGHGGFHVQSAGRVLEIVDEHDRPCPPGVPGRVLVTDLTNRAMGLIRYENGDVAAWSDDERPCACGSPFPRLARVHGRTSDFITTQKGERIHGEWFTHLFYGRADVTQFQVHQRTLDDVELLTVGAAGDVALTPLLDRMRQRLGPAVRVTWRRVDEIPVGPSGKRRFTLSDVPWRPEGT